MVDGNIKPRGLQKKPCNYKIFKIGIILKSHIEVLMSQVGYNNVSEGDRNFYIF